MKKYLKLYNLLEVGYEHLSEHLCWLLRACILNTCSEEYLTSINYNIDLPHDKWGEFFPEALSISFNLEYHFWSAIELVQDEDPEHAKFTSIKFIILRELLDTAVHEAWHAKTFGDNPKIKISEGLDEEGAKNAGQNSTKLAEFYDVNIESFGPILDELIDDLHSTLKEDAEEDGCPEWKKLQLHMLDNNLAYYNPKTSTEIKTFREAMEAIAEPEHAWSDESVKYFTAENTELPIMAQPPAKEVKQPAAEPTIESSATVNTTSTPENNSALVQSHPDWNPYDDCSYKLDDPFADDDTNYYPPENNTSEPVQTAQPTTTTTTAATPPPAAETTPDVQPNNIDVGNAQRIAELVFRRLFYTIYTKCEPVGNGTFNNPHAVLDPVYIGDIEGATELFDKQDLVDKLGNYHTMQKVNGMIRGLVSKTGLPTYKVYLKIGTALYKRVFIPQNPAKMKDNQPTPWAIKVQQGWKICMLSKDGAGITADISASPETVMGQETFKIWQKN